MRTSEVCLNDATAIGVALPVYDLAPLEYRYALDVATAVLTSAASDSVLVYCNVPQLKREVQQRLTVSTTQHGRAALWLEPMVEDWRTQLDRISCQLLPGAPLALILSLPLARLLPERRTWVGHPVAMNPAAVWRLYRALKCSGFSVSGVYGLHSPAAIALNQVSRVLERLDRPDLADRFHFAGRLAYRTSGLRVTLSTVALAILRRTAAGSGV